MKKLHICTLKFVRKLSQINFILFFLLLLCVVLLDSYVAQQLMELSNDYTDPFSKYSDAYMIAVGVIFAPLFETFVFQFLIIEVSLMFIKKIRYSFWVSVIVSAILFAANHCYFWSYVFFTIPAGIILSVAYYATKFRRCKCKIITKGIFPFLVVCSVHCINNLIASIDIFLK